MALLGRKSLIILFSCFDFDTDHWSPE